MRKLILLPLLVLLLAAWQFSLPAKRPLVCSGQANNCAVFAQNGNTGIIIVRGGYGQSITAAGGPVQQVLQPDYDAPFTGMTVYHMAFTSLPYNTGINFTLPPTASNAAVLLYEGIWDFSTSAERDYSNGNDVFAECAGQGDCPNWWTNPVVPEKGSLMIGFADANATGCGAFTPGPGWSIETTDCIFAVEDKIATVEAPDIGSMYGRRIDGGDTGGSHWIMGLAVYTRVH